MRIKPLALFLSILMFSLAVFACRGDDDDDSAEDGLNEPTATGAGDGDGDGDDDDGDEPTDAPDADILSRGEGTVVIDGETFNFVAERCLIESMDQGGTVLIGGPGTTADGEPMVIEVEYHRGGEDAIPAVQVGVGVSNLFSIEQGNPNYIASAQGDFVADINGGAHISFTSANFFDRAGESSAVFDGSVDVSCE